MMSIQTRGKAKPLYGHLYSQLRLTGREGWTALMYTLLSMPAGEDTIEIPMKIFPLGGGSLPFFPSRPTPPPFFFFKAV